VSRSPAIAALIGGLLACLVTAGADAQLVRTQPPPGFDGASAPKPAVVDIWFDGARLGTANVLLGPGRITFDDPAAVAALLAGEVDVSALAEALSGELATHAARRCEPGAPPDCGTLDPEVAGVIVDAATFRVDVFVADAYRERAVTSPSYLERPAWSPSAVQGFSIAASAVPEATNRAVLGSQTRIASGPARLAATYGIDTDDGAFTDDLTVELDWRRWRAEAGLSRASLVPLLGDRRFAGARIATTLDTRLDRDAARAQPLVVSVPRRAQVEILREGRLLGVQTVPAGTRALDTEGLPIGAYDVTLRISSSAGIREETRFFVKSGALPPTDNPRVTLDAGVLAAEETAFFPELGDTPFMHGGARWRLGERFGAGPDVAVSPDEAVVSVAGAALWPGIELAADAFAGTEGTLGAGLATRGRLGGVGFALGARRILADVGENTDEDNDDRLTSGNELASITAFADDSTQVDLSLTWSAAIGPRLGVRGVWRRDGDRDETFTIGPNLYWPLARVGAGRLDLFAEGAATDAERFVFARLRFSFAADPWRAAAELGWRAADDSDDGPSAALFTTRDVIDRDDHLLTLGGRAERQGDVTSLGGDLDYRGWPARLQLAATHDVETDENRVAIDGRTTMVIGAMGVGIAGLESDASALVVDLDAGGVAGSDAVFEVLVDDRARRRLRPGERATVPLRAYEAYRVRLRQVDGPIAAYDGRTRRVTLYPGTVASERWTVRPLVSVFGRLVDAGGDPLGDARLDTDVPVFTDAGGYFQAELPTAPADVQAVYGGGRCDLALPELVPTTGYQRLGDVPCLPTS